MDWQSFWIGWVCAFSFIMLGKTAINYVVIWRIKRRYRREHLARFEP